VLLANLARILSRRLVERTTAAPAKITALLTGPAGWTGATTAVATARTASAAPLTVLDATGARADPARRTTARGSGITPPHELRARLDAAAAAGPVLLHVRTDHSDVAELLDYCDRTVAVLPADGGPDAALAGLLAGDADRVEPTVDPAWLGRRLARASVGIALGAGGAKGWAHVGALRSLQRAGYVVDAVAGSSIGAWVGAWTALGYDAGTVEQLLRDRFDADAVQSMFRRGGADGAAVMARLARETTADAGFADLAMPLSVLTADLSAQRPVSLTEDGVADALVAAMTVPGLYPPVRRGDQRLVDAVVLTPVPTAALAGVDVTIAINLLGRQALPAWPGGPGEPGPEQATRDRDPVVESLELASFGAAAAQTAAASVPVTPRFGPGTWRDFGHADQFLDAGEEAMEQALSGLRALARPGP
jgi:NTE family protein